jgi:hypothetical protein
MALLTDEVLSLFSGDKKLSLNDIYALLPDKNINSIRNAINLLCSKNKIKRIRRGEYSL